MDPEAQRQQNIQLVREVLRRTFIERDPTVVAELFAADYTQHNPMIPNGRDAIAAVMGTLAKDFRYEPGRVAAEGDIVMVHGRYTGWAPKPVIGVDIFRVAAGKVAEHWDVLQEEVPAAQSKNGNPMFP